MKKHAAWVFLLPLAALANELPPMKPQPIKPAESHSAPDAKAAKATQAPTSADAKGTQSTYSQTAALPSTTTSKPTSKHAVPQQMSEPIKMLKPATAATKAPVVEASAAPEVLKPTGQAVTRYVSPQFSATQSEVQRPVVKSKAPKARTRTSNTAKSSYIAKPGLVRVLPAAQIPSNAVIPPAKQIQWSGAERIKPQENPKSNVIWGAQEQEEKTVVQAPKVPAEPVATPVVGRKIASPKYYTETNQGARWQHYSYP